MRHLFLIACFVSLLFFKATAQIPITDARKHLNEKVSICDKVYDIRAMQNNGQLVLSFGAKYPKQLLSVVIPAAARSKFGEHPEGGFKDNIICVTGIVTMYEGKLLITVTDPSQLKAAYKDPMDPNPISQN